MLVPYTSGLLLSINVVLLNFQNLVIVGHSAWDMESSRNLHVDIVDLHWGLCKSEYKVKLLCMPALNVKSRWTVGQDVTWVYVSQ